MCGIFGILNYGSNKFTTRTLLDSLACRSSIRGSDATGFSWNRGGRPIVAKAAGIAYRFNFDQLPKKSKAVIGHVRQTTCGSHYKNFNNHPFMSVKGNFTLAHNGILFYHENTREDLALPSTEIETDSYLAVQILDLFEEITFDSLKFLCENIVGDFVFTVLDNHNNIWIAKDGNPISIINFKKLGLLIYASTYDILINSIKEFDLLDDEYVATRYSIVSLKDGNIIKISSNGSIKSQKFDNSNNTYMSYYTKGSNEPTYNDIANMTDEEYEIYLNERMEEEQININPKIGLTDIDYTKKQEFNWSEYISSHNKNVRQNKYVFSRWD